jgi:hypothetical protein
MTLRNTRTFAPASLALICTLWFSLASAQDENPTTPGAIPDPSTYQGSMQLQQQEQQQNQQYRQQEPQQSSYPGQPQQGGYGSSQSSGGRSQSSGGQAPPWAECQNHVVGMRALAPIAGKTTLGPADPARVELFDDQSKPTAAEKILLAKWDEARRYCWSLWQEDPRDQTATARYMDSHWGYPAFHALITQLMNGQITFGQFNYQRAMNERARQRYWEQIQQKH